MTSWIETYRGAVPPWQCDMTEHFTIAYYFERLEDARANLADALGLDPRPGLGRIEARFVRELRQGASFHFESAVLGVGETLRLGHRVVDSGNGETVTWFDEYQDGAVLTAQQRTAIEARLTEWPGPAVEPRTEPLTTQGFLSTARGRVKRGDLDSVGGLALGAMVHRFSSASNQLAAAIGMSAAQMQLQRRGFSTFELNLRLSGTLTLDAGYVVRTGIAHLGNSSLRMVHVMTEAATGQEVARMGQYGVNLDLDARRPTRWPEAVRERAAALVVPVG